MRDEQADVTVQPSISTEEAAETDVELSPVGDEKVEVPADPPVEPPDSPPAENDANVTTGEAARVQVESEPQVRSAQKREIDMRIMPWDTPIPSNGGLESFARGAFAGTNPAKVMLVGVEHERKWALGHNGDPELVRHPVGKGLSLEERADGAYMTFKVANTPGGDEVLALVEDGITTGVSVEFDFLAGGTQVRTTGGRRHRVNHRVRLNAVSPTYRPAYGEQAAVLAVRSQEEGPMAEDTQEAPVAGALSPEQFNALLAQTAAAFGKPLEAIVDRLDHLETQARSRDIVIPGDTGERSPLSLGEWTKIALAGLSGDRLSSEQINAIEQVRTLDDVVTTDNLGVIPQIHIPEVRGVIDTSRPFLASTRRLDAGAAGTTITVPIITQRPTTAVQSQEKAEVDSTKTIITSENFDMVSIAGAGDLSIQVIKRSSPSFLALWMELLAEAYAIDAEDQALRALFDATGGVGAATALDPENLLLGTAFQTSFDAIRKPPNTLWLSTEAVAKFIDAKANGTNAPLYPGLEASATAAGGITGNISGLRVVHVPTLDSHGAFAVVGPSTGFAWAEDGTYELQADVPSKAGRDVGIIGMMWFVPWYPAAFTTYNVAS